MKEIPNEGFLLILKEEDDSKESKWWQADKEALTQREQESLKKTSKTSEQNQYQKLIYKKTSLKLKSTCIWKHTLKEHTIYLRTQAQNDLLQDTV